MLGEAFEAVLGTVSISVCACVCVCGGGGGGRLEAVQKVHFRSAPLLMRCRLSGTRRKKKRETELIFLFFLQKKHLPSNT